MLDGEFNETTTTTTTSSDGNVTVAARSDAVNASITTDVVQPAVYGRHCALVGIGWLFWYPAVRPLLGFVAYYIFPMLLIGILYGRVVCTLLTSASQRHLSGDREQLRRKQAARSNILISPPMFGHTTQRRQFPPGPGSGPDHFWAL